MGFDEHGAGGMALRHGASAGGNDHVHVVVQLVDETASRRSVHNDRPRAQETCRELEQRHGLRQVEGRQAKRGARATELPPALPRRARAPAELIDSPEPDRDQLEAKLRVAGAGAGERSGVRAAAPRGRSARPPAVRGRAR